MTPQEAYTIIARALNELSAARGHICKSSAGLTDDEIEAQAFAYTALRRMEETDGEEAIPVRWVESWFMKHYHASAGGMIADWRDFRRQAEENGGTQVREETERT